MSLRRFGPKLLSKTIIYCQKAKCYKDCLLDFKAGCNNHFETHP